MLVPPRTALHPPMAAVAAVEAKADPTPSSPVMMHSLNKTGKKRKGKEKAGGGEGKEGKNERGTTDGDLSENNFKS